MIEFLETERLMLKDYSSNDLGNIHRLLSEPLVWKYSSHTVVEDMESIKKRLSDILSNYSEHRPEFKALFLKDTKEYIGEAGILSYNKACNRGVIGYNLLPNYWGMGFATEICRALTKQLFEAQNLERVEALVCEENKASRKVLEKSGFTLEGLLRNFAYINDKYENICFYCMIRKDYWQICK